MMRPAGLVAALVAALLIASAGNAPAAVPPGNPLFGIDGDGNIVPGPQVPFGFANPSPDSVDGKSSGYREHRPVIGFSQTHVSGTGGYAKYGNFRITPVVGPVRPLDASSPITGERAHPGYYAGTLTRWPIGVELTASHDVGVQRFRFPARADTHILIDACSYATFGQQPLQCSVTIVPPDRIEGSVDMVGGWNPTPYTLYFSARFDRAFANWGTFYGSTVRPGSTFASNDDPVLGAYASFDARTDRSVTVRVGLSFTSTAAARRHLETEAPSPSFDVARAAAERAWTSALDTIRVSGGTASERELFFSALYQSQRSPHDLTGENVWWSSRAPHYEDFYAIWDTFRTVHPLLTLIQLARQRDMLRSLVDTFVHVGWVTDARVAGANGLVQGGSNADVLFADAIVKGVGGFSRAVAYAAMRKNATVAPSRPTYEGRRSLATYEQLGFVPYDREDHATSRTLEYAYDDFCDAEVAQRLGRSADAARFLKRAANWRNVWDASTQSARPRRADGGWLAPFDRETTYPDLATGFTQLESPFHEGSGYQYSTYVPQDGAGLVAAVGGDRAFVAWLDRFFDNAPTSSPAYRPGRWNGASNEHDLLAPYLYAYAGRPDRTDDVVRRTLHDDFHAARNGWPGNDDSGALSAWYVWGAIGLYPNAGQPWYFIGSPIFRHIDIALGGGRHFLIDAPATSAAHRYVVAATLDGHALQRAWLTHAEIAAGGHLVLQMSDRAGAWGSGTRPPSMP
jgi:predicted alpha-1,2-mannosidase